MRDHMVALFFTFLRNLYTALHRRLHQFTFPSTVYEGSLFSIPSPALVICKLFNDGSSDCYEVRVVMVWVCFFLIIGLLW